MLGSSFRLLLDQLHRHLAVCLDLGGAVFLPTKAGALPVLVHRAKQLYGGTAVWPMLEGTALLRAGLGEARVAATEEVLGTNQWAVGRNQPARLHLREGDTPGWVLGTLMPRGPKPLNLYSLQTAVA